jgi:hypothetical protein
MTTRYPTALPPVPEDSWHASQIPDSSRETVVGGVLRSVSADFLIDATSGMDAETRVLAYLDKHCDDDLRDATATARHSTAADRFRVTVDFPRNEAT